MQRVRKPTFDFVSANSASSMQPLSGHHEINAPIAEGRRIGEAHVRMSSLQFIETEILDDPMNAEAFAWIKGELRPPK
jgi:hypothetical protein